MLRESQDASLIISGEGERVGERGGVCEPLDIIDGILGFSLLSCFIDALRLSLVELVLGALHGMSRQAATCSRSFCLTLSRRFSASSSLLTQSSILLSSSASASSCRSKASQLNLATLGERR